MSPETSQLVQRLWKLCNLLKDDGVNYSQYVNELTYLLFIKMAWERELHLGASASWDELLECPEGRILRTYESALRSMASVDSAMIRQIFKDARSEVQRPSTLRLLITAIDKFEWFDPSIEAFGDLYEGLLEKNSIEAKSGAGQYFTPRPIVDSMVALMKPRRSDVIQDPAAGTGGFLVAAHNYIISHSRPGTWSKASKRRYLEATFFGLEHVRDTQRLAMMNLYLHGLDSAESPAGVQLGDSLSNDIATLPRPTLILSNPPFGVKGGGGRPDRDDLPFTTSNKQLSFLQHSYTTLRPGGRAAIIVPDNVLFGGKIGRAIRSDLMEKCNLHTILRLPTGLFYAAGVQTNVIFFSKGTGRGTPKVPSSDHPILRRGAAFAPLGAYPTRSPPPQTFPRSRGDDSLDVGLWNIGSEAPPSPPSAVSSARQVVRLLEEAIREASSLLASLEESEGRRGG